MGAAQSVRRSVSIRDGGPKRKAACGFATGAKPQAAVGQIRSIFFRFFLTLTPP
jgi:hypothetical protein